MKFVSILLCAIFLASPVSSLAEATDSLYSVPFMWRDENGKALELSAFKGAPVLLTLAYTKCKSACPLTMQRMKRVASELQEVSPKTQYVIVSLDPENDTPKNLADFRRQYKLDERWHFLRGSEADLRKLAVLLGYSYQQRGDDDQIAHSNKLFALDSHGHIKEELEGLNSDTAPFVKKISGF